MNRFAALFATLDSTTKTSAKVTALADYFRSAPDEDRLWAIALLSGKRPRRSVSSTQLRVWAAEKASLPLWLFEESYAVVGDLAETIALILPVGTTSDPPALSALMGDLAALSGLSEDRRKAEILATWDRLGPMERLVFNKLITGGFRLGVSRGLVTRALAQSTGMDEGTLAHRLMGDWTPTSTSFDRFLGDQETRADTRPYPFALASGLEKPPEDLGDASQWTAEWKWDGIRGQLIHRDGLLALWSRGEELITDRFPEFALLSDFLPPGTALDGEVVVWDADAQLPMAFNALQKRIGRKSVTRRLLAEAPARFIAYDLLEAGGKDIRSTSLIERRARLETLVTALPATLPLGLSPPLAFDDWARLGQMRQTARQVRAEGVMIKQVQSPYHNGRKRGEWWKWKLDPWTVDAVMVYAQAGHGRRANLFTDFTFALRDGDELVPFTKAYSGLTDQEFGEITRWVQKNTLERFGPVRRVTPELVFEIGFEGIQESPRHKSGIALRFPRMIRWRKDKPPSEIDTLETLRGLLAQAQG
ncbi:MAG: ATP-dependent DNA ligase [Paracoccaceae bacterium]